MLFHCCFPLLFNTAYRHALHNILLQEEEHDAQRDGADYGNRHSGAVINGILLGVENGNAYGYQLLFGAPDHDQRPKIAVPVTQYLQDGKVVRNLYEEAFQDILFAVDGEVYNFNGYKCIVIGGAYSVDKHYRLAHGWHWWPDEQPDEEIKAVVEARLAALHWNIDIVLSHTCPRKYEPTEVFLSSLDQSSVDKSTEDWLDGIEDRLDYKKWYCGHYHTRKQVDKIQFMFEDFDTMFIRL